MHDTDINQYRRSRTKSVYRFELRFTVSLAVCCVYLFRHRIYLFFLCFHLVQFLNDRISDLFDVFIGYGIFSEYFFDTSISCIPAVTSVSPVKTSRFTGAI